MKRDETAEPVLRVSGLAKQFRQGRFGRAVHAVNGVSFNVYPGETVGMVGESGSGKTTIGRMLMRLVHPTSGSIAFEGRDILTLPERALRKLRSELQFVFQYPWSSLNPRLSIRSLIEEPLRIHTALSAAARRAKLEGLVQRVHLKADLLNRFPGQLSGGQLQRVCIARALATEPKLLILDEPTSALDLSVRASIIDLLREIQDASGMGMVFISHDLATVRSISKRVVVLYRGTIVEEGPIEDVFGLPRHPYTKALMSAHLPPDPAIPVHPERLAGEPPSPSAVPEGCVFATRCPIAIEQCATQNPQLLPVANGNRRVALQKAACLRL